jgi:hypothetical protein
MVFMSMCVKLYDIDQKLNVVPQLAASPPTISQDGRSAEIKLRQGVRFNDDTTLDAEAVKKSRTGTVPSRAPSARASCWRRCWPTVPAWSCRPSSSTSSAPTPAVQNHRTSGTTASEERRRQPHAFPAGYLVA